MKKKILYFEKLNFQKENIKIIQSKFNVIKFKNLKMKNYPEIISIFLPMDNYYPGKFFSKFINLRSVVTPTTGDIHLDKNYLKKKKIKIISLKNFSNSLNKITSTSELTLGLIMNMTRQILFAHNSFIKNRIFNKYNHLFSNNLYTLGIVGLGRIGHHLAERAKALGFNVIYFDPFVNNRKFKKIKNFQSFLKKTNILTIHMHYKKKFYKKFNLQIFQKLKKPSFIINTSRGEFINEDDLIYSLKKKIISGAGLDVLTNEHTEKFRQNPKTNKLFKFYLKNKKFNLFISPKQGGSNLSAWSLSEKILIKELMLYE